MAGGKLWFGYGAATEGNIGSLDLPASEPVVTLDQDTPPLVRAPTLDLRPRLPNALVAGRGRQPDTWPSTTSRRVRRQPSAAPDTSEYGRAT